MHQDQLDKISSQHRQEVQSLHRDYEKVIAVKVDQFHVESEQLSISHLKAIEDLQSRSSVELQELQDEFRMTFNALERKLATEKEDLAQAHAKELADSRNSYEEKIAVITKHHEGVIEVLNKNYEEAMDNVKKILTYFDDISHVLLIFQGQELQQSLDYLRLEFQAVLAAAEAKETQHKAEVEKMSHTIQFKENEITHLGETLRRREKETADEWIQRETSIMSQLTEQNQKSVEEFETRLQEIRAELHQAKEEIGRVAEERDAARDDIAVLQVGATYLLLE
jgi:hypothetical protein